MDKDTKSNLWQALSLAGQLGYTIAVPLVVLALTGRFLDKKFGSSPWFLLGGVLLSLVITSVWIYKKSAEIIGHATKDDEKPNHLKPNA